MNYVGINTYDTANGEGIRVSLFVSGCTVHCKDCFNKESWDFSAGRLFTNVEKQEILTALGQDYIEGFSLLGGDPFEKEHEEVLLDLLKSIKEAYPNKHIWAWTGRTLNKVKDSPLLEYIDVLIDGAFIKALYIPELLYRGSTNQEIHFLYVERDQAKH